MTAPPLRTERRRHVTVFTLDRPQARNAFDRALSSALLDALVAFGRDDEQAVGVITGAGGTFSAGMDLKAFASGEMAPHAGGRVFGAVLRDGSPKPLVAAVEGHALAGGLELALTCDVIVAARGAQLGVPEVRRSLVAAGGALLRLPDRLPAGVAAEMLLTGDPIDAERAHALGLVNRLAPAGQALAVALEVAERIAANGPLALRATKAVLAARSDWGAEQFWTRQPAITDPVFASADAHEGAVAFAERRVPQWTGR
jgi:enoyl-CoA hydratase